MTMTMNIHTPTNITTTMITNMNIIMTTNILMYMITTTPPKG
jgi:hypothetical protein